jgi:hypothetical protein
MGCGCRNSGNRHTSNTGNTGGGDLTKFAYLTPKQLKIKQQQQKEKEKTKDTK